MYYPNFGRHEIKDHHAPKKILPCRGLYELCTGLHSTGMEPEGFPEGPGNRPEFKVTVAKEEDEIIMRPAPAPRPPTEKELEEWRKQREQKQQQLQLQQQEEADNAAVLASQGGPLRQLALRQAHLCSLQASPLLLFIHCSNARSSEGSQGQGSQRRPEGLFESPSRKIDHPETPITKTSTITPEKLSSDLVADTCHKNICTWYTFYMFYIRSLAVALTDGSTAVLSL